MQFPSGGGLLTVDCRSFERKALVTVALWYQTRVLNRGEGRRGTVLPLYLILDEKGNLFDLQQRSTISTDPNELPFHVIDVATTSRQGYWSDSDEQDFWERWVMNPTLPDSKREEAHASARAMMQRHVEVSFNGESLREDMYVRLYLRPLKKSGERLLLMELEVDRIYDTVFDKET